MNKYGVVLRHHMEQGPPRTNVTRGVTPHFFTLHYYILPLPLCSLRAANGRPYTVPFIRAAHLCHSATGRKANLTPDHGPGISLRSNITLP